MSAIEKRYRLLFYFTLPCLLFFMTILFVSLAAWNVLPLLLYCFGLLLYKSIVLESDVEKFRAAFKALPPERRQRLDEEFVAAGKPLRNRHWTFLQEGILVWDTRYRQERNGAPLTILRYEDISALERDRMALRVYLRSSGGTNGFYYTYWIDKNGIPPILTEKSGCPLTAHLSLPNDPSSERPLDPLTFMAAVMVPVFMLLMFILIPIFLFCSSHN